MNLVHNPHLDGLGFATFAHVTEGFEHIQGIYAAYREFADQGLMHQRGGEYIRQNFPLMTYIDTARRSVAKEEEENLMEEEEDLGFSSPEKGVAETGYLPVLGIVAMVAAVCGILGRSGKKRLCAAAARDDPKDV